MPRARIEAIPEPMAAAMRGRSWRADERCPPFESLRLVLVPFVDFEGREREGELVVAESIAPSTAAIFTALHAMRFPIHRIDRIDRFEGDDDASMAANNTSAFNFRTIPGSSVLSHHALGVAIDLNPEQNPMIVGDVVHPPRATPYVDRAHERPGMILEDGPVTRLFAAHGFHWGGLWPDLRDYHHFSALDRGVRSIG